MKPEPWRMLSTDDITLCTTDEDSLQTKVEMYRTTQEGRGLKISGKDYEVQRRPRPEISRQGGDLQRVDQFDYLDCVVTEDWIRQGKAHAEARGQAV